MTQAPPPQQPQQVLVVAKPKSGLAIAAMVLGLSGIIPFLGVLTGLTGAILGVVSLAKGAGRKGMALTGVIAGVVLPTIGTLTLMVAVLVPALGRARELSRRVWCASNLNAIVKGATLHQEANDDGAWPADPKMLIGERSISAGHLQCPSADSGRKMDFFYLAPAEPDPPVGTIIACDLPGNHDGEGRNVVYADSHVEWTTEQGLQLELADPLNTRFAQALKKAEGP